MTGAETCGVWLGRSGGGGRRDLAVCAGIGASAAHARFPVEGGSGGAQLHGHGQQGKVRERPEAVRLPHYGRRDQREAGDVFRRQPAGHGDSGRRHAEAAGAAREQPEARAARHRAGAGPSGVSWAPTCSSSSIPATSCTTALCTRRTPSPISCAASTRPIRWRSTPSAAICRARRT